MSAQRVALELASKPVAAIEVPASKPPTVEVATVEVAADAPDISTAEIWDRLGFMKTPSELLTDLGFESKYSLAFSRSMWREADFRPICAALVKHIQGVAA